MHTLFGRFCNVRCRPGSPRMDACSLGNVPSVAGLDTGLATILLLCSMAAHRLSLSRGAYMVMYVRYGCTFTLPGPSSQNQVKAFRAPVKCHC